MSASSITGLAPSESQGEGCRARKAPRWNCGPTARAREIPGRGDWRRASRRQATRDERYLGDGTNNIAELTAILRGLDSTTGKRPVRIYTDSEYSIGVLPQMEGEGQPKPMA